MKSNVDWLLPAMLLLLSAVPLGAGVLRIAELWSGAQITPENARFFAAPLPVVLHIVTSIVFSVVGAFQFSPRLRQQRPDWHRAAGQLLTVCGLAAALSGLWMTQFYPRAEGDGELLYVFRLVFGAAMALCLVFGFAAIRRRDILRHRAWMTRGYALGLGAGTQVVVHIPWFLFVGKPGELARALLLGAGWVINLAVAEWSIRARPTRPIRLRNQTTSA